MKLIRLMLVVLLVAAACSDSSDGGAASTTVTSTPETTAPATTAPATTAPATTQTTTPATTTTLLQPIDDDTFGAIPVVETTSTVVCQWFDPRASTQLFEPADCGDHRNVAIDAVTIWCPTGSCDDTFEVVIETADDFVLTSPGLLESVEIALDGTEGGLFCAIRGTESDGPIGCLDIDNRLTIPPEDVWLNSVDGLRHRFGPGASFIGELESVSVTVSRLGADQRGPLSVYTDLEPNIPGRVETSIGIEDAVVRYHLEQTLEDVVPHVETLECGLDAIVGDPADLLAVGGHGMANVPDNFIAQLGDVFEACAPIEPSFVELFAQRFPELTQECLDGLAAAASAEFDWERAFNNGRDLARGLSGPIEQQTVFDQFIAATVVELGCA